MDPNSVNKDDWVVETEDDCYYQKHHPHREEYLNEKQDGNNSNLHHQRFSYNDYYSRDEGNSYGDGYANGDGYADGDGYGSGEGYADGDGYGSGEEYADDDRYGRDDGYTDEQIGVAGSNKRKFNEEEYQIVVVDENGNPMENEESQLDSTEYVYPKPPKKRRIMKNRKNLGSIENTQEDAHSLKPAKAKRKPKLNQLPAEPTSDGENEDNIYLIKLEVHVRDFVRQNSDKKVEDWDFSVSNLADFLKELWQRGKSKIAREIVALDDDKFVWGESELSEMDLDRFLVLNIVDDKRNYKPSQITPVILSNISKLYPKSDKDPAGVVVFIYQYSTSMRNKKTYDLANKALIKSYIKDKSGAGSHLEQKQIANQLKEIHKFHFHSDHDVHWMIWADRILRDEPHKREELLHGSPGNLIHLFTAVAPHPANELQNIRSNISVSCSVTAALLDKMTDLEASLKRAKALGARYKDALDDFELRFQLFSTELNAMSRVTNYMDAAIQESSESRQIYANIIDAEDADHADE